MAGSHQVNKQAHCGCALSPAVVYVNLNMKSDSHKSTQSISLSVDLADLVVPMGLHTQCFAGRYELTLSLV